MQPTVVASHKRIAVAASHLAVDKFPCALEGNVHVAINGLQLACAGHTCQQRLGRSGSATFGLIKRYQAGSNIPLYTTPEFNFTVTGAPIISLRKPEGSRASFAAGAAVLAPLGAGADILCEGLGRFSFVECVVWLDMSPVV